MCVVTVINHFCALLDKEVGGAEAKEHFPSGLQKPLKTFRNGNTACSRKQQIKMIIHMSYLWMLVSKIGR